MCRQFEQLYIADFRVVRRHHFGMSFRQTRVMRNELHRVCKLLGLQACRNAALLCNDSYAADEPHRSQLRWPTLRISRFLSKE